MCTRTLLCVLFLSNAAAWSQDTSGVRLPVNASGAVQGDRVGTSVAVAPGVSGFPGIPGAVVLGAPGDSASGADSGAVYVFEFDGTTWLETARITSSDLAPGDAFGHSVAIAQDGTQTIVVGAPGTDVALAAPAADAGALYVFERGPGGWMQTAKLVANDGASGDALGSSVALMTGAELVAGAPGRDGPGVDEGAAYVFSRELTGAGWVQQARLTASDSAAFDRLGAALATELDLLLIGAPGADSLDPGAAYAFARSGSDWFELAQLAAGDGAPGAEFGGACALAGTSALIGAPGVDAAYVFELGSFGATETAKLSGVALERFGTAVALSSGRAIVGAPEGGASAGDGAVFVYELSGASWIQTDEITDQPGSLGALGSSTATDGTLIVAGAPGDDEFPEFPGSGWIQAPCWYTTADCNGNGEPDWCDIQSGVSNDCNQNWTPDECDPFQCRVDVVFLFDTSSSMFDESDTLCAEIASIDCQIYDAASVQANTFFYGISDLQFGLDSDCPEFVDKTVLGEFGSVVPGNPACCGILDDCNDAGGQIASGPRENWGPATSIVSEHFAWTPGAIRVIVPITDEGPWCGNPCNNPDGDEEAIQHAIAIANQNNVVVSPIMGDGADECVVALANLIADDTGGSVFQSFNAEMDLLDGIVAIVSDVCGPEGDVPICAGDGTLAPCPCGNNSATGSQEGCANSTGAGARLSLGGTASLASDTLALIGEGMPDSVGLYFQATTATNGPGGAPFGSGLYCGGGALVRLGIAANQDGASRYPGPGQDPISIRGGVTLPGSKRVYQLWYRDAQDPCGIGFNLSTAWGVVWHP